ncbi:LOG family protein [Streptomyces violascens]|uniref:Cytokinin riboside 5'-monophosphate phosphoribohydrolase n=1 Tax=Streptomyces violascens TaxID=67381 RepID=A0ABQ3QXS7_9ACTN|nr:TIGR00730 family Rossman fold protein [Streptomyces violascens]GGU18175.1 cytokinin riboside 5'-monophosphate phosphoribohydrolase [Streptomyces violascens]GHI42070.1 cytokinin riboside 5'-monophosphate phosphoribohydrolase [Streptomyces violascens]
MTHAHHPHDTTRAPATARPLPRSIAVYTGSALGASPAVAEQVRAFGSALAKEGITVVYGGGRVGLMGVLADSALAAGGKVVGVMPRSLVNSELAHTELDDLQVVSTMHERKARMAELAEAFVALPGGSGTLEEFFEVWTWGQLGLHTKPVSLLDIDGSWQSLVAMLQDMVNGGFLARRHLDGLVIAKDTDSLLQQLSSWTPPQAKWT